jgi:hypothetical protein
MIASCSISGPSDDAQLDTSVVEQGQEDHHITTCERASDGARQVDVVLDSASTWEIVLR